MMNREAKPPVLVVDDEPQILTSIQDLLEDKFSVSATTDAREALAHLKQDEVAVVLSDQRMPDLSGDEFLGIAAEISQATRILITGYSDMEALVRAVNRGQIYAYVAKPWDPVDLRMKITQAAEHYRLQARLVHEQALLQALMTNIPDAIYFKDTDCRFTRLNKGAASLLGRERPDEAVGKTPCDFSSEEWARNAVEDEQRIVQTGVPVVDKVERIRRPGGQFGWLSSTKVPFRSAGGSIAGLVGISRDITERMDAAERLARQAEELTRYNAELERFAYVSAHDLQEPLRTVASFTQLLAQRYGSKLDADGERFTQLVVGGCARMRQLIDDLLTYSRIARRPGEFAPTDCQAVFQQTLENLRAAIDESSAAVTCDPLPTVRGDASRLGQLFSNLIGNALKFRGPAPPRVHVSAQERGSEWVFSVRDNGIGIDPKHSEQIFDIFQRLHGKYEYPGTGVGLAICKRIVESHHGRIWVQSELEKGATFYFTIPGSVTPPAHEPNRSAQM